MGCEVYANGDEIACKAGDGKVIAAFPDVCLTPPPPPAGPIPVPYPDTSFSKDMQNGSKTVQIKGQEVMLKDSSFYKTSPLGDEAATNGQGAGVVTHVITGKTYFVAWSMDVLFEGQNVDRHTDMTTSNHASPMANAAPPWANISAQTMAAAKTKCPCCEGPLHSTGTPMNGRDWYNHRVDREGPRPPRPKKADPGKTVAEKKQETADILKEAEDRPNCTCPIPRPKLLPEDPCNVFYSIPPAVPDVAAAQAHQSATTTTSRTAWFGVRGNPSSGYKDAYTKRTGCKEVMHLVPLSAGGCPGKPGKDGNLECKDNLCGECKKTDSKFTAIQTVNINN